MDHLAAIFSRQQRVTATFMQKNGRTLHIKATAAEPNLYRLYEALELPTTPGGSKKMVH